MQSNYYNIDTIFNNEYIVPYYQRPYSWKKGNIKEMLEDFKNACDDIDDYYLGQIIVIKNKNGIYDIVDGQQRVITLYLLFMAISNEYRHVKLGKNIENKIIKECDDENDKKILKIQLLTNDVNNYLNDLLNGTIEENKEEDKIIELIKNNYEFIKEYLKENFTINNIKSYIGFIRNKVCITFFEVSTLTNALRIFNTINQRGLNLRQIDLLKGLYCSKLDNIDKILNVFNKIDKHIDDKLKDVFLDKLFWSFSTTRDLNVNKSKKKYDLYENVYNVLKKTYDNDLDKCIESIDDNVDIFINLFTFEKFNKSTTKEICYLLSLPSKEWISAYMAHVRQNSIDVNFLKYIKKIMFNYYVCDDYTNGQLKKNINDIVVDINKSNKYIDNKKYDIDKNIFDDIFDNKLFYEPNKNNTKIFKCILVSIEIYNNTIYNNVIDIINNISINRLIDKNNILGNLVIISKKNCHYLNGSLTKKKKYYSKNNIYNFKMINDILKLDEINKLIMYERHKNYKQILYNIINS